MIHLDMNKTIKTLLVFNLISITTQYVMSFVFCQENVWECITHLLEYLHRYSQKVDYYHPAEYAQ